jgi:hypothetical protein
MPAACRTSRRSALPKTTLMPLALGVGDALRIDVEGDEGNLFDGQEFGDAPAGAAEAADHHVLPEVHAMHRDVVDHGGLVRPVAAPEVAGKARRAIDQEGGNEHRQQHGRERDLEGAGADQFQLVREFDQHQAEFAGLRELRRGAQAGNQRRPGEAGDQQHHDRPCRPISSSTASSSLWALAST